MPLLFPIHPGDLLRFMAKAHRHTYAAPPEIRKQHRCATPILRGHKDYHFTEGVWAYHDSYADTPNAPGREVVFLKDEPVWTMAYHGKLLLDNHQEFYEERVFPFLREALINFDESAPFRGPKEFAKEEFTYKLNIDGDYESFVGAEGISFDHELVFYQKIIGGLA